MRRSAAPPRKAEPPAAPRRRKSELAAALTPRESAIKAALDSVRERCDLAARFQADPISFAHRFVHPLDKELVALVSASVAFGNVRTVHAKLEDLLGRVGPVPRTAAEDLPSLRIRLRGWKHRVFRGEDLARLFYGARSVQREHGSLEACFKSRLAHARASVPSRADHANMREALAGFSDALRAASGLHAGGRRRGPAHLLPDVRGTSGSKRLLLFLKWVSRPADGVDLGLWTVDPALLLVPIDVHLHRLGRNLGLTRRRNLAWETTEEMTRALARFDPADPTKYDFSLCHLGMVQHCPSRKDARRCEGCGVQPVCIHWGTEPGRARRPNRSAQVR